MNFPHCYMISIKREYRAIISILSPIKIMTKLDHKNDAIITNNSPIRFIVGGKAGLVRLASTHHVGS